MAIHAETFNLVNNLGAILVVFLRACLGDFAPHVLEEVLRKALMLCHIVGVLS